MKLLTHLKDGFTMKPQAWALGTLISAITMISYVHAFVYTRTEAEDLKKSVERADRSVSTQVVLQTLVLVMWN
jgi:hypothetical protein